MIITNLHQLFIKHNLTISTDSRNTIKNTLFFALKGENFDGNKYALQALKNGAKYAVVDNKTYFDPNNKQLILVNNTLKTLQALAKYHREQFNIPVIGLTGSNGKTTTKALINAVLKEKYNIIATKGNLNNHIGVPLTLLRIKSDTEIAIVEMGANHPKEIAFLCDIAQPVFGYITNFGKAHLEGFGSLEGVIQAKSELYDFIDHNDGLKFINADDEIQAKLTKYNENIVSFCTSDTCQYTITMKENNPFVTINYNKTSITSNLMGMYNFNNIAAAVALGAYFKVPTKAIKKGIENYIPNNNRSQLIKKGTNSIILDAYNANPTSTQAALENFASLRATKKVIILGDMFELGEASAVEHQNIANLLNKLAFEQVFLAGENYFKTKTSYQQFKTFEDLKISLSNEKITNATILIKGSRGMQLERVLDLL